MAKERLTGAIVVGLLLVGLAAGGFWLLRHGGHEECSVCRREIHAQSRALVEVNGQREALCCARCAVTLARQRGNPQVVGGNRCAVLAQGGEHVRVMMRRFFIGFQQVHPRRGHEMPQFVAVLLRARAGGKSGEQFPQHDQGQVDLVRGAQRFHRLGNAA